MDPSKKNQIVLTGCIIGWILLSATPSGIAALTPNLTVDTLLEGSTACPNQTVVFTCHTMGPLAWSSEEYIGTGGNQLPFGLDDRIGAIQISKINESIYAELMYRSNSTITSTFHITASSSSSVKCTATANQTYSVIHMRILEEPGVPEDPVAIQISDMRYEKCFIPVMWKNAANSDEARVTHYTININQDFMSNQTANSTAYYSLLLATECAENHTVDISATNLCGMTGPRTVYSTQRQRQECPTDTDSSSCVITDQIHPVTKIVSPTATATIIISPTMQNGYSEQNRGNILLIIASGIAITTVSYLLSSLYI